MKTMRTKFVPLVLWILCLLITVGNSAQASPFTWDADGVFGNGNQDGGGTWSTGIARWNNGATDVAWPNSATNDDVAVFGVGSGAAGTVSVSGTVNVNSITFNAPGSGTYTIGGTTLTLNGTAPTITTNVNATISAPITGTAGLTKNGTGMLTLSGTNTFSGGVTISGGTLSTSNLNNIISTNSITLANGGTWRSTANVNAYGNNLIVASGDSGIFNNDSGNVRINGSFSGVAGSLTFDESDAPGSQGLILDGSSYGTAALGSVITYLNSGSSNVNPRLGSTSAMAAFANSKMVFSRTGSGLLDLRLSLGSGSDFQVGALDGGDASTRIFYESAAHGGTTVTINGTVNGNFAGVLSSAANGIGALIKNGTSTQILSGNNTYAGTTVINNGILQIGNGGTSGTLGSGAVTITSPGHLTFNRSDNPTVSNQIGGIGGLTQAGSGALTLNGNNSYGGGTTVRQGVLILNSNTAAGGFNAGAITLGDASTGNNNVELRFGSGITGNDLAVRVISVRQQNPIIVANTGSSGTATLAFQSGVTIYSDLTLNRSTTITSDSTGVNSRTYMGQITGTGAGIGNDTLIIDSGAGNWNLMYPKDTGTVSLANTYSGNLFVKSGNLQIGNLSYLSGGTGNAANMNLAIPDTASVTVNAGSTLRFVWGDEAFDALNGAGTIDRNTGDSQGNRNLTIGASGGSGNFGGTITSQFNLIKAGSGTQILSGANSYTGGTTINDGTLLVNNTTGSGTGSAAVTVNVNGTLGGTGNIANTTNAISLFGTVSPGNGVGTLSADSFNWQPGGTYAWEVTSFSGTAGVDWDLLNLTGGTLTFVGGGPFNVEIDASAIGPTTPGDYVFEIARADSIVGFPINLSNFNLTANGSVQTLWSIYQQGNSVFLQATVVPEPSTLLMFGFFGLGCVLGGRFINRRRNQTLRNRQSKHQ